MKNSLIYTILFSFILTALCVVVLAFINVGTKETVQQNVNLVTSSAYLKALKIDYDPENKEEILKKFMDLEKYKYENGTIGQKIEGDIFVKGSGVELQNLIVKNVVDGNTYYAKQFTGGGLWGPISIVLAADDKLQRLSGMTILSQAETPGLGSRIDESWFTAQFVDQKIPQNLMLKFTMGGSEKAQKDKDDEMLDGITGATRTVDGVSIILNKSIQEFKSIFDKKTANIVSKKEVINA